MYFYDVRITLLFGKLELLTEITLENCLLLVTLVCNQERAKICIIFT